MCDYCGAHWRRSQLRVDGAGFLVCPDEGQGRDTVTLDLLNADSDANYGSYPSDWDGGSTDYATDGDTTQRTDWEDI